MEELRQVVFEAGNVEFQWDEMGASVKSWACAVEAMRARMENEEDPERHQVWHYLHRVMQMRERAQRSPKALWKAHSLLRKMRRRCPESFLALKLIDLSVSWLRRQQNYMVTKKRHLAFLRDQFVYDVKRAHASKGIGYD